MARTMIAVVLVDASPYVMGPAHVEAAIGAAKDVDEFRMIGGIHGNGLP